MKKLALHWQILLGMLVGVLFALVIVPLGQPEQAIVELNNKNKKDLIELQSKKHELTENLKKLETNFDDKEILISNYLTKKTEIESTIRSVNKKIEITEKNTRLPNSSGKEFILDWIKPFGNIFINLLKLIAVPLILASLIKGVSDLKDISKLSKMGGRTIGLYLLTTVFAVSIGLVVVLL